MLFRTSITVLGLVAVGWELLFIVSYFSTLLGHMNQGVADVIMNGAAICGIISALTCYFPLFLKSRFNWTGERQGIPVATSFVLLFFGLGVCWLVVMADWIGSM